MEHATSIAPKSQYDDNGIHAPHFYHKREAREKFYQHGVAPIDMKTGDQIDSKKQPSSNERQEGKPSKYMGKPGQYGKGVQYHALPTKQSTHNLRKALKEGNVTYLKEWYKHNSDIDPSEQPMLSPIHYDRWRKAGEDMHSGLFTENRGYELPHVEVGKARPIAHGTIKDTPLITYPEGNPLVVNEITPAANMDYNAVGYAISRAIPIEPSHAHHARAKKLMYALAANDSGESLEKKVANGDYHPGIGHSVGKAAAEIVDFVGFVAKHH